MCQNEHQISWVVKMVHQIYSLLRTAAEKLRFIQHLENMFTLVTMDMMQFSVIGGSTFNVPCNSACLPLLIINNSFLSVSAFAMSFPPHRSHSIHHVCLENHFGARRFLRSLQFFLNLTAHFHTQLLQMLLQYNTRDCGWKVVTQFSTVVYPPVLSHFKKCVNNVLII